MADNTERLVVEVDVGGLGKAGEALDDFVEKADGAGEAAEQAGKKTKTLQDVFGGIADPVDDTGKALTGLNKNYKDLTISQGQYTASMRMLPAQMTDIVTQLAGGQNPFLIMIQQGGQIKDSFGGLSNTFKILKSSITPMTVAFGAAATAIGLMGAAAYKSGEQFDRAASSIIFMGGAGFKSLSELSTVANEVAEKTGTSLSSVTDTLIDLNDKGKMTADQMKVAAVAIQEMGKAGRDTNDAMQDFAKLTKDPIKGMAELNEQYGFVTEAQAKYIIGLKKSKGDEAATTEAIKLFSEAMQERSKAVVESTDNIGRFWLSLKTTASDSFSQMGVTIRAWGNQVIDIFKMVQAAVNYFFASIADIDSKFTGAIIDSVMEIASKVPGGEKLVDMTGLKDWQASVKQRGEDARKELETQGKEYNKLLAKVSDPNAQAKYEAEARYSSNVKATGTDEKSRQAVSDMAKAAEKKAKAERVSVSMGDRLVEQYQAQSLALEAQISVLRNRSAFQNDMSQQMKDYQLLQAKINILEKISTDEKGRALTAQEKQLLAQKDEVLAAAKQVGEQGEVVRQLQKQAQISDELTRSHNDITTQVEAIAAGWGKSATEAERLLQLQTRAANLRDKGATEDQIAVDAADMEALWKSQDAKRGDWVGGLKTGMEEFANSATDYASIAQNAVTAAFGGMSTALDDFVTTGKLSMKDFTTDMLKMIVQIINKWLILKAIQGIGSAVGGSFGDFTAGLSGASSPVSALAAPTAFSGVMALSSFDSAPQARTGSQVSTFASGVVPEPQIKSAGGVANQVSGSGGGTSIAQINVTVADGKASTTTSDSGAVGRAYAAVINDSVNSGIERAIAPGGRIFMARSGRG